jgi:hypothetical protein
VCAQRILRTGLTFREFATLFALDQSMTVRWFLPSLLAVLAVDPLRVQAQDPVRLGTACFAANGNDLRAAVKVRESVIAFVLETYKGSR